MHAHTHTHNVCLAISKVFSGVTGEVRVWRVRVVECVWGGTSGDCQQPQRSRKRKRITGFTSGKSDPITLISTGRQKKKKKLKIQQPNKPPNLSPICFQPLEVVLIYNCSRLCKNISVTSGGWWSGEGEARCGSIGCIGAPCLQTGVTAVLPRGDSEQAFDFLATPGSSQHSYFYAVRTRPDCKGAVFSGRYAGSLTSDPCWCYQDAVTGGRPGWPDHLQRSDRLLQEDPARGRPESSVERSWRYGNKLLLMKPLVSGEFLQS